MATEKPMYLHTATCETEGCVSCRLYTQAEMDAAIAAALAEQKERDAKVAEERQIAWSRNEGTIARAAEMEAKRIAAAIRAEGEGK